MFCDFKTYSLYFDTISLNVEDTFSTLTPSISSEELHFKVKISLMFELETFKFLIVALTDFKFKNVFAVVFVAFEFNNLKF